MKKMYTFDNYIFGSENRQVYHALMEFAELNGIIYNPMYIYGPTGLGKTHLLLAFAKYVSEANKDKKVIYITCETYVDLLIDAIKKDKLKELERKYTDADILIIDDLQYITERQTTQECIFRIINTLFKSGKKVLLASNNDIRQTFNEYNNGEKFVSLITSGLMIKIDYPSLETKKNIIKKLSESKDLIISEDVVNYIAEHAYTVDRINGSVNMLKSFTEVIECELTQHNVQQILRDYISPRCKTDDNIIFDCIRKSVAKHFDIYPDNLLFDYEDKNDPLREANRIAIFMCDKCTGVDPGVIGEAFGGYDLNDVLRILGKIEERFFHDEDFQKTIWILLRSIIEELEKRAGL